MNRAMTLTIVLVLAAPACGGGLAPVNFDAGIEPCRFCRMTGSDGRSAAQLLSAGQEPLFFDDIGCLRDHLRQAGVTAGGVMYVTDHRTRAWVKAEDAIYTRHAGLRTPMSSNLVAHASPASRDADPAVSGGTNVTFDEIFRAAALGGPAR